MSPQAEAARALASSHRLCPDSRARRSPAFQAPELADQLDQALRYLRTPAGRRAGPKAAEWFFDNYHLIRKATRQVREELPPGFARRLPQLLENDTPGARRVDALARSMLQSCALVVDVRSLKRFIDAYQEIAPLTIAELWALPTLLRGAVLEHVIHYLQALWIPTGQSDPASARGRHGAATFLPVAAAPISGLELAIRALRVLDVADWSKFFRATNRVEAILQGDPAGVYSAMDFQTADRYRTVVEDLAWETRIPEASVAEAVVSLASNRTPSSRASHVGYFLLGRGRDQLEKQLRYSPSGVERLRRFCLRNPTAVYLCSLACLTFAPLAAGLYFLLASYADHTAAICVATALGSLPLAGLSVAIVHWAFAKLLSPRVLPKLDYRKGLPPDVRTLVVIPALLGSNEDVAGILSQIELHYLANPDPQLAFAVLTDDVDSLVGTTDRAQRELLKRAELGIRALNLKHGQASLGPFHLMHRGARWNPSEQRFMGWERKRGKLEELNRLLRGDKTTSYSRHVGDPRGLERVRFVITLDADTELPMGGAKRLIGILAHPLNQAVFAPHSGTVVDGYTVIQPRVETSPSTTRRTPFSRIYAEPSGVDAYTHASSELYQDLFGAGIYVGKGIYDVDSFMRSVEDRVPENSLVSHDLFEGIQGRTGLATDVRIFEGYPTTYVAYTRRLHRWLRGDWQLLPWLLPFVPSPRGRRRNQLSLIDRWKIVDNLRRSLSTPATLGLLLMAWLWLPGDPALWTIGLLLLKLAPELPTTLDRQTSVKLVRSGLGIVFLAYESVLTIDAIIRTWIRKMITGRGLLQWTSAAHTESQSRSRRPRQDTWQATLASPVTALLTTALLSWFHPAAITAAAPLLLLWAIAPEVARWLGTPQEPQTQTLDADQHKSLRMLARRSWAFFDAFVGPNDQWLPIDNHQEAPHEQTAHRTSPTNIGLMLVATVSAHDFGYIGAQTLASRLSRTFESIQRLQHYQGHLLNWYDTTNLQPLLPRYVSTVDSGNFAGCLLCVKQGCLELTQAPIVRPQLWRGLQDTIDLLDEVLRANPLTVGARLQDIVAHMRRLSVQAEGDLDHTADHLRQLADIARDELSPELLELVTQTTEPQKGTWLLSLREAVDRLNRQLSSQQQEVDTLLPWLALQADFLVHELAAPSPQTPLASIPAAMSALSAALARKDSERSLSSEPRPSLDESSQRLQSAFALARECATTLIRDLHELGTLAQREVSMMDFGLVYDAERRLFHIGYNASADHLDENYYDLLASEARIASYIAIVKRDVPESHWYALGRPMTRVAGDLALLSWGGTMFEYLMPTLFMRSQPETLLSRTCKAIVTGQVDYARALGGMWGVSESAYASVDNNHTYQYKAFGVPGLGLKRGLGDDRVIAPYACVLALAERPASVHENILALERAGMLGRYGLFEALDLRDDVGSGAVTSHTPTIVRSYMAHHQGMLLISLGNYLNSRSMQDRFHAEPLVLSGELLLNEREPESAPVEYPSDALAPQDGVLPVLSPLAPLPSWSAIDSTRPQAFVLGNGRLSSILTDSGGGGLSWKDLSVTRFTPDPTLDRDGLFLYLRDDDSGAIWRATSHRGRTTYSAHEVAYHSRAEDISVRVGVTVAAADDVELRHITLHNESNRQRVVSVTTAGRPVLFAATQAGSHPVFSSLFVHSEWLPELDGLLFTRRQQTPEETQGVALHRLVSKTDSAVLEGYESDRAAFFGRSEGALQSPEALRSGLPLGQGVGWVLDPVMCLMARVTLEPQSSATFAFVTCVAATPAEARLLGEKYGSLHSVEWAFRDAQHESPRRVRRANLDPDLLPAVQRLYSALLVADPNLRVTTTKRAGARARQAELWGLGLSGDEAIVVVRVHLLDAPLVEQVLAAHAYLRLCGASFDLVLMLEQPTGYADGGPDAVRAHLQRFAADESVGRRGGIFPLYRDQLDDRQRRHLESCAQVLLDTRAGGLRECLGEVVLPTAAQPSFRATSDQEPTERELPDRELQFDSGMGGFSADGSEYVIKLKGGSPTPAPWCNVLANATFGTTVSETRLGSTWSLNSRENRLTPWKNDPVLDPPAEALYLRDEETGAAWSSTSLPRGYSGTIRVSHGMGYSRFERDSHDLQQEVTVFVPPESDVKLVRLRIRNASSRHRRVTATYFAEWSLGARSELERVHILSEFDREHSALLARSDWHTEFRGRVAFLASRSDVHGFTTDRTEFLGRGGDYEEPAALKRWGLSNHTHTGADPCAALQIHLSLAPYEEIETHFLLGQASGRDEALELVRRLRDPKEVASAWDALKRFWDELLGGVVVRTPEPSMDLLLNRWLLYQSVSARLFGRTGFYQSSGAFGFRDQLQDVLALLHTAPGLARAHILEAARHQFLEGDVLHWWHPPSGAGVRTRCSDDLLWLPYVTGEYVAATGDLTILEEDIQFLDAKPLLTSEGDRFANFPVATESGSLLEHCRRALNRGATQGAHGLPLMQGGDWNDGMNRIGEQGRGESVWLAWFLAATMQRFSRLLNATGEHAEAREWDARSTKLLDLTRQVAWDGEWYLRAFHDDGSLIGSHDSLECRLDSIAQSWSVLASERLGADARPLQALESVQTHLVRSEDRLALLFWPPFDVAPHAPGYVSAYPRGVRENGGQYTHAAAWLGLAHVAAHQGDRAEELFRLLNPILRVSNVEDAHRYRVEPYVIAADVYSVAPWAGRGGWTWYTGAAAWMWRLGVEGILGIHLENGNLCIDPCIPRHWEGFEAWLRISEMTLHVRVTNPHGVSSGVEAVRLDSKLLDSNLVVLKPSVETQEVLVTLGGGRDEGSDLN